MVDRIDQALNACFDSIKHRMGDGTRQGWVTVVKEVCTILPVEDDGEIIGAVLVEGQEVHLGIKRRPRMIHRGEIRTVLRALFAGGPIKSRVANENVFGLEFCKRLGFEETHRDSVHTHLECRESRYV
jgi:hypothetical protein